MKLVSETMEEEVMKQVLKKVEGEQMKLVSERMEEEAMNLV